MKLKIKIKYSIIFILLIYLSYNPVIASTLSSIFVQNNLTQSKITIYCYDIPTYTIFSLHNPERIVVDLEQVSKINKHILPIEFHGNNLIKCIRTSNTSLDCKNIRIVYDLHHESNIQTVMHKKIGKYHSIILIFSKKIITTSRLNNHNVYPTTVTNKKMYFINNQQNQFFHKKNITTPTYKTHNQNNKKIEFPIIVAIDAGHGGHDPGATSYNGIYEKYITLGIAKKLQNLLNMDPIFKAVMIRDGDYFLSVMDRSDLARKKRANILVSIHADSVLNSKVRGASIWVLSNQRAKTEMMHWLQSREKYAELLGGLGEILVNYQNDPYLNHLVLDLQFGYSQRESYNIALAMLDQLKNVSILHKNIPEYSNFGILRAPDIASVLVETGFISNIKEAYLLKNNSYQSKIAQALYKGLRSYFVMYQEKKI